MRGVGACTLLLLPAGEDEGLGSRYTGEVDAMDGDVVCRHSFALSQQEQQFLAFVAHGDDVCLVDMLQIVQGKGEVEHGGEFYQYVSCLAQQQFFEGGYIGFAVADGYGLSAVSVAAGRVYEYTVHGLHLLQMADAVCVADGDVVQAEDREVVCGYLAEGFLALDVSGMPEAGGEIGAVDAETSGEVGKGAG